MTPSPMSQRVPPPGRQRSYWIREALAADPHGPASPPVVAGDDHDVVIIGGGYTGMWTAYCLTQLDPSIRIAILEQDVCGGGPSGRNGGFLHGWWDQLPLLERLYGRDAALDVAWAADEAVDGVRTFLVEHGIDAWYRRAGYLRVSASPAQDGSGLDAVRACARLGAPDQLVALGRADVQARCASPAFRAGTLMPNAATIQPARLARGLRRVLMERGVRIHEGTRAAGLSVERGGRVAVRTPAGSIRGVQVVLAVNAWAGGWAGHRTALVSWGSYMALTEPCPPALQALGWTGGEAIADARFTVHYFRTTPDGRVAFGAGVGPAGYGGRIGASFDSDVRSAERVVHGLRRLLPTLEDVRVEETWGGPIDVSTDRLPVFGMTHGGRVHHVFGFSGNGVGPSHLAGRILAARIAGTDDPVARLPIAEHRSRRFPPEPLRSVGVRLVREALIRRDEAEDAGRRPGPLVRGLVRLPALLGYRIGAG